MKASDHRYWDEVHNRYAGERLFILGTAPSLKLLTNEEVTGLTAEHTMGLNFLFRWNQCSVIGPDFWVACEADWIPQIDEGLQALKPRQLEIYCGSLVDPNDGTYTNRPGWVWVHENAHAQVLNGAFSGLGPEFEYVCMGHSGTLINAIQIGCWLGFQDIYLVGVDSSESGHIYEGGYSRTFNAHAQVLSLMQASARLHEHGRVLYDCSPVSRTHGGGPEGTRSLTKVSVAEALSKMRVAV